MLYNPLGQRVRELWSGYASGERRIGLNTTGLSSGLYIACARKTGTSDTAALTKVMVLK